MDFDISDEQSLLLDSIDDFFQQNPQFNEQYIRSCESQHVPMTEFKQAYLDAGFGTLGIPEQYGGTPVDVRTLCMVAERVEGHGFPSGMGQVLQVDDILTFGTEEQKKETMNLLLANKKAFSLGFSEPQSGSDSNAIATSYERKNGKIVINGHKTFNTDGARAKYMLCMCRDFSIDEKASRSITCFMVPLDAPGVTIEPLNKLGQRTFSLDEVYFDNVEVPESAMVGEEYKGFYVVMKNFELERLIIAAGSLGMATCAYNDALQYATQREQFGQPIGNFQLIQEMLVKMRISVDNMRNSVYHTAWEFDSDKSINVSAALTKFYCAQTAFEVCDMAMQVMGGIGYSDDSRVSRLWRDSRQNRIAGGTDQIMIHVAGRALQKEVKNR